MLQASSDPETNRFFRSPLILLHVLFHLGLKIVSLTKKYTVSPTVSKLSVSRPVVPDSLRPPWTAAHQAPLSMRFTKQGYWSGLPFPSPGDLPNPAIEPGSPALQADSLPPELHGKPFALSGQGKVSVNRMNSHKAQ